MKYWTQLFCLTALVAGVHAAIKPDFSGEWKLNPARSELGEGFPAPTARTDAIEHHEPNLRAHVQQVVAGQQREATFEYTTDGKECINQAFGNTVKAKLQWEDDALLIHSSMKVGGFGVTLDDRWTLSDGGKVLTISRHIERPGRKGDQKLVFEKQ